jgi:hypothetical protein
VASDLTTKGTPRKRKLRRDYTDQEIDALPWLSMQRIREAVDRVDGPPLAAWHFDGWIGSADGDRG